MDIRQIDKSIYNHIRGCDSTLYVVLTYVEALDIGLILYVTVSSSS